MRRAHVLALFAVVPLGAYVAFACGGDDTAVPSTDGGSEAGPSPDSGAPDGGGAIDGGDGGVARCGDYNPLKNPYFGDLHAHTSYSADAYAFDTRNTPLDAYAFARGKTLQVAGAGPDGGGPLTTIEKPLDFLAVTDHSEFLAVAYGCGEDLAGNPYDPTKTIYDTVACRLFRSDRSQTVQLAAIYAVLSRVCDGGKCAPVVTSAWQKEQQAAAAAYEPCKFSTMYAYEWTKTNDGVTLHKNVIFGDTNVPASPLDSLTHPTQEELWRGLAAGCGGGAGCEALTIPHNGNLSQGLAFEVPSDPVDRDNMARYQRLVEIFQHKGGSECLSDDGSDPDCAFELLPDNSDPARDKPGYVREGLKKGLGVRAASGKNPLMMGIVGATDGHNGTPGNTRESTWPGHVGSNDDTPARRIGPAAGEVGTFNPGGLTVAWAEQNTRESIYAALKRRETHATSGTRVLVRMFQTFDAGDACADPAFPKSLVDKGAVPMGGSFKSGATAPRFVIRAWKDQAPLARVDVVKAWVDGAGALKEKVVQRALPAASATACITWQDDDPTPGPALYYARVLEDPTPRWSAYDCARAPNANPAGCADGGALRTMIQERAWTSPIWREP
ncbi:MAG: DUF3604 domain-containing protein [Myxococcales bacterium]|nr:DUF3604 domain-containing protein [Myxococcales bacterium]